MLHMHHKLSVILERENSGFITNFNAELLFNNPVLSRRLLQKFTLQFISRLIITALIPEVQFEKRKTKKKRTKRFNQ